MAKPPAFQFYAKDWLSDGWVSQMSLKHQGIYIRLLAAAWVSDEPGTLRLPLEAVAKSAGIDIRSLRDFMSRSNRDRAEIGSRSHRCWIEVDSKLVNLKLAEQWAKYKEISEIRRKAAESRYPANAQQKHHSASSSAFALTTSLNYTASQERKAFSLTGDQRENLALSLFEKFWIDYPKKLDREETLKLWLALSPLDQTAASEAVLLWVKSEEWKDPIYVPSPGNFLRKRRWESRPVVKRKVESLHEQLRKLEEEHGIH